MRAMHLVPVQSSILRAVAYDDRHDLLEVHFRDGAVYHYLGVPAKTHQELLAATSKGVYFNRQIRGRFHYEAIRSTN